MKERYKVVGTFRLGDKVRLFLKFDSLVKEKEEPGGILNMVKMAGNMDEIQEKMQVKMQLAQQPDVITISYEEWLKYEYKVEDVIYVEVTSDKIER